MTKKKSPRKTGSVPILRVARLEAEAQDLREQVALEHLEFQAAQEASVEAHQAAELLSERYTDLFESAPVGYLVLDRNGFIHDANRTAALMLGTPSAPPRGTLLAHFVAAEDRRKFLQHLSRCRHGGCEEDVTTELRMIGAGGRLLDVMLTSRTEPDVRKPPAQIRFRTALVDLTARKRAEAAVRESEAKYAVLFGKSPIAKSLTQLPDRTIVEVNEAFVKLFGFTRDEVIGRTSVQLGISTEEGGVRVEAELKASGSLRDFQTVGVTKSGARCTLSVSLELVTVGGRPHVLATLQDITARKQAEEELRARNAELTQFNELMVDRELRMVELKKEINELARQAGRPPRYEVTDEEKP